MWLIHHGPSFKVELDASFMLIKNSSGIPDIFSFSFASRCAF